MSYREFLPHPALTPYIDAYWTIRTEKLKPVVHRIMPDGCVDIIINLGSDFLSENRKVTMRNETSYLVGTMTVFKDTVHRDDTHLIGIRFKPLGFSAFYKFSSLHEITNTTVEFEKDLTPLVRHLTPASVTSLDLYFLKRLSAGNGLLSGLLSDIKNRKGIITVYDLGKAANISKRQLERHFKHYLGISPKEYTSFVRYQFALETIKNNHGHRSLQDIAFSAGYYDHAHLTNEVRKYAGLPPSAF